LRIRVAGTNGKGSTSFMLAAALQACGLKVGLYTSPHILEFNERIRINGTPISTERLWQSLEILMPIALELGASYFETATALALDQFGRQRVDVEILEAGVGARLDATTAVAADMALITPIALDHQNWLGDTLIEIAHEKSYVMQDCQHSISAPQNNDVARILRTFNADIHFSNNEASWHNLSAIGLHQRTNASLAWAAINQLATQYAIDLDAARLAILHCQIPGRLQRLKIKHATVWLDAAHNSHAVEALLPSLPFIAKSFDAILVFTREDRSLHTSLPQLQTYTRRLISNDDTATSPATALQTEIKRNPHGHFLVLGSFTSVAAIIRDAPKY